MKCHVYKNFMFVLLLLVLFNLSFMAFSLFSTNLNAAELKAVEGRYATLSNSWRTRVPLFGKSIEDILDQLSRGPQTPVFLYKPVCRSDAGCASYSGLELRKIFTQNGFDIVERNDKDWTVSLTNGVSGVPKVTKVWQYTNIIPGMGEMCLRERLCLRLEKLSHQHDLKDFKAFPKCVVIHGNATLKLQKKSLLTGYWLLRKAGSLRGSSDGLLILNKDMIDRKLMQNKNLIISKNIPTNHSKTLYKTRTLTSLEKYIHNPFIIKQRKHLLRFYLLVKSIDPLRIYVSDFGDVAFAQMPYKFEKDNFEQNVSCMHLDINTAPWCAKNSASAWNVNAKNSLVWTLKHYWSVLSHLNIDVSYMESQIRDALLQTGILLAATSSEVIKSNYSKERARFLALKKNAFVIFHVKILLDKNKKAHVIDIDCDPGLQTMGSNSFRSRQMVTLIQDLIKLSGSFRGKYDRKPYKEKLTDNLLSFCGNRGGCSVDEMQTIVQFEDERHNAGHFQLIYPHPNTVNSHKTTIKDLELDSVLTEYVDQIRKF